MNNPSERARKKAQEILDHYYKSHQDRCDHTDLLNEIVEAFHIEATTKRILSDEEHRKRGGWPTIEEFESAFYTWESQQNRIVIANQPSLPADWAYHYLSQYTPPKERE